MCPRTILSSALLTALAACASAPTEAAWTYQPDLAVSHPPYATVHTNWKERLAQPYVYVEHVGSYTVTGRLLAGLHERMLAAGVAASGPPFGLYFDDPGEVAVAELRSRACFPIEPGSATGTLTQDVLPAATVVYAVVSGPYPGVARAYPALFEHAGRMGWIADGPVREVYLTPPSQAADPAALLCEIQVPVTHAP